MNVDCGVRRARRESRFSAAQRFYLGVGETDGRCGERPVGSQFAFYIWHALCVSSPMLNPSRAQWRQNSRASAQPLPFGDLRRHAQAFTLIELLTVIAIISIVAGLVVGMSSAASRAKKDKLVVAELEKISTAIESYHAKLGYYPPDNGNLSLLPAGIGWGSQQYENYTATNPLLYELTGSTNLG